MDELGPLLVSLDDAKALSVAADSWDLVEGQWGPYSGFQWPDSEAVFFHQSQGDEWDKAIRLTAMAYARPPSGVMVMGEGQGLCDGMACGDVVVATRSLGPQGFAAPRSEAAEALSGEISHLANRHGWRMSWGIMATEDFFEEERDVAKGVAVLGAGCYGIARACYALNIPFAECRVITRIRGEGNHSQNEGSYIKTLGPLVDALVRDPVTV